MPYNLTVKQRIQKFAETTNLEDKYFEQRVGMSNGMLRRENNPTTPMLEKLKAAYPRLDMNWLITGEGSMLLPLSHGKSSGDVSGDNNIINSEVAESVMPFDLKRQDLVSIPASVLLSLQQQLENKDTQISSLQAQITELIKKL